MATFLDPITDKEKISRIQQSALDMTGAAQMQFRRAFGAYDQLRTELQMDEMAFAKLILSVNWQQLQSDAIQAPPAQGRLYTVAKDFYTARYQLYQALSASYISHDLQPADMSIPEHACPDGKKTMNDLIFQQILALEAIARKHPLQNKGRER